jgi:hypothetical protein
MFVPQCLVKKYVFGFVLLGSLGLAQNPYNLPLSFQGNGVQQTATFTTTGPWKVTMTSSELASLYLYDVTTGQNTRVVTADEVLSDIGTYFLYVNTGGSWQLSISPVTQTVEGDQEQASESSSDTTTSAQPSTTEEAGTSADTTETSASATTTALDTSLPLKRFGFGQARFARPAPSSVADVADCDNYATVFEAQDDFITLGGPNLDPYNLDPDGDGYACSYNPLETYEPPVECEDGKVWVNPKYGKGDGEYNPGKCKAP